MSTLQPAATPESVNDDATATVSETAAPRRRRKSRAGDAARAVSSPWASATAIIIAVLWTIPTFGLLVTSFRDQRAINTSGWWTAFSDPGSFTLENYRQALAPGTTTSLSQYFINTIVITIPAVILPLFLASLAAYAFAWMPFPGRDALFVAVFALQIVPAAGRPHPAARHLHQPARVRGVLLERVAVPHDLRAATGDVPHPQLHERAPGRS